MSNVYGRISEIKGSFIKTYKGKTITFTPRYQIFRTVKTIPIGSVPVTLIFSNDKPRRHAVLIDFQYSTPKC